ncbi:LamG domain-containing protein [Streptomyces shenzhenensis]|uniref:LamG domain-containing protein n=1 Tax=Streptomyces shenzhenensis TaxID=943815 RepID=UPI001F1D35AF|nr:LamG domain-containing protein [Streptomyces shenzhenensis]
MTTADLILHWHLDEVLAADGVVDASDNHLNGTPEGAPKSLPDERFGSCLALDGATDALTLGQTPRLALTAGYTVEAWINPGHFPAHGAGIAATAAQVFALALAADGSVDHVSAAGAATVTAPPGSVPAGVWTHIAATSDGQAARTYINATLVAERPLPTGTAPGPAADALVVGRLAQGPLGHYDGRLVHVRVYDGPLTEAEIGLDMAEDEAELAAFVRSHPVDFELANQDQHPVLFIDDGLLGQPMTLTVRNTSRQEITLRPLTGPVSAVNHHLALRFRPQTLATTPEPVLNAPGWQVLRAPDPSTGGDTLYFLCTAPAPLRPGAGLTLPLTGMNADGRGGTRGTRVELGYQQLTFTGETDELSGSRLQFLDVVNHLGRTDIPLRAAFSGGNRVLSDGSTPNTLRLRVANASHDQPLTLTGTADSGDGADGATSVVVTLDVEHAGESTDWALLTAGAAPAATLAVTGTSDPAGLPVTAFPQPLREIGAQSLQWKLTVPRTVTVPPTGWLELTLAGLVVPASLGQSQVYVSYVNVPGYADAATAVTVEKSPLLFAGQRAGLGTTAPQAKLQIVDAPTDPNSGSLVLGPTDGTSSNLRMGYHTGYSWIQSHGSRPLALNPIGNNVGIGTTEPSNPLTVSAASAHLQLRRDVADAPAGNLLFLELFQAQSATQTNPSIRFHQSNSFWHRIEARPEGFHLKTGDLTSDALVDLYASTLHVQQLNLAGLLVRLHDAEVLNQLSSGELQVELYDIPHSRSGGTWTLRLVGQ